MIHAQRLLSLHLAAPRKGGYVLLWVQASVRTRDNHALQYAIREANRLGLPVCAVFGLTPNYPEANARHYLYLLQGVQQLGQGLQAIGIPLQVALGSPPEVALQAANGAALVVTDCGYLRHQRQWRQWLAQQLAQQSTPLVQVESEAVVPVQVASTKLEYAARTIRPKLQRQLPEYLRALEVHVPEQQTNDWDMGLDLSKPEDVIATLGISPLSAGQEQGGEDEALSRLDQFIQQDLSTYHLLRNDPSQQGASRLSAYLHYGHLSPLTAALGVQAYVRQQPEAQAGAAAFLEELIVRRELSFNFTTYQPHYDRYEALPQWAQQTLAMHSQDPRPYLYDETELEAAQTHDPYWNAAQQEMVLTGRMHNYMRMYWGKKILEWTPSPQQAFEIMLRQNNRYQQDGRDPNSFVGVLWVLGLHDRPWARRPVFGTVRYMNAGGLKRKFDIDAYVRQVQQAQQQPQKGDTT